MKRIIVFFIIFATMCCTLFGCSLKKRICAYDGCEEVVEANHTYCTKHRCLFCEESIEQYKLFSGEYSHSHYCSKHRCKYDGAFGQCTNGVAGVDCDDSLQYCCFHKDLDLSEFKNAEKVASNWNRDVAAPKRNHSFLRPPFQYTNNFYVTEDGYYFEVYDTDYFKYGYIIVLKDSGELHCDGMRYK